MISKRFGFALVALAALAGLLVGCIEISPPTLRPGDLADVPGLQGRLLVRDPDSDKPPFETEIACRRDGSYGVTTRTVEDDGTIEVNRHGIRAIALPIGGKAYAALIDWPAIDLNSEPTIYLGLVGAPDESGCVEADRTLLEILSVNDEARASADYAAMLASRFGLTLRDRSDWLELEGAIDRRTVETLLTDEAVLEGTKIWQSYAWLERLEAFDLPCAGVQPLMPGAWLEFTEAALDQARGTLEGYLADYGVMPVASGRVRALELPFYAAATLYELEAGDGAGGRGAYALVQTQSETVPLDGRLETVEKLNSAAGLRLETATQAEAYLRFMFGTLTVNGVGQAPIVTDVDTLPWRPDAWENDRARARLALQPVEVEPAADGSWRATAAIIHETALRTVEVTLGRDGRVAIASGVAISGPLPVLQSRMVNYLRLYDDTRA